MDSLTIEIYLELLGANTYVLNVIVELLDRVLVVENKLSFLDIRQVHYKAIYVYEKTASVVREFSNGTVYKATALVYKTHFNVRIGRNEMPDLGLWG